MLHVAVIVVVEFVGLPPRGMLFHPRFPPKGTLIRLLEFVKMPKIVFYHHPFRANWPY
jgi:hypothetical protein